MIMYDLTRTLHNELTSDCNRVYKTIKIVVVSLTIIKGNLPVNGFLKITSSKKQRKEKKKKSLYK